MNFTKRLNQTIGERKTRLCVGLDPEPSKIPEHLKTKSSPLYEFNKTIIDKTQEYVAAYKPNSAFYEAYGTDGIGQLKKTCDYIKETYPGVIIILDAKRADIGNTNKGYVSFAFDYLGADAVTLHPYLGREAIQPFLDRADRGSIILCRTSNTGAGEFQDLRIQERPLYRIVAEKVSKDWNKNENCMLVVGATYPKEMQEIRKIAELVPFLIPGVGAQGGDLEASVRAGLTKSKEGVLISASRSILYGSSGPDFGKSAEAEAKRLSEEIEGEVDRI